MYRQFLSVLTLGGLCLMPAAAQAAAAPEVATAACPGGRAYGPTGQVSEQIAGDTRRIVTTFADGLKATTELDSRGLVTRIALNDRGGRHELMNIEIDADAGAAQLWSSLSRQSEVLSPLADLQASSPIDLNESIHRTWLLRSTGAAGIELPETGLSGGLETIPCWQQSCGGCEQCCSNQVTNCLGTCFGFPGCDFVCFFRFSQCIDGCFWDPLCP